MNILNNNMENKIYKKRSKCLSCISNTVTIWQFLQTMFSILIFITLIIITIIIYKFVEHIKQDIMVEFDNIKNDVNTAISFIEDIPQNISKIITGGISSIHL